MIRVLGSYFFSINLVLIMIFFRFFVTHYTIYIILKFCLTSDTTELIINLHKKIKFFSVIAKHLETNIEYRIRFIGITAINLAVIFVF